MQTAKENARIAKIAALNDAARKVPGSATILLTRGIRALLESNLRQVMKQVQEFNAFTIENDPFGEHDFGSIIVNDDKKNRKRKVYWKIDYYARGDLDHGSEAPEDESKTTRVLTIMLSSEY